MSTSLEFPQDRVAGRLFVAERCHDLDESMIEWLGDARGTVTLPEGEGYVGIVLTRDTGLRRQILAQLDPASIQLIYFTNPFELRSMLDDLFPEITQVRLMLTPDTSADDNDCALLRDLCGLRALDLSSSQITNTGVSHLTDLLTLEALNLADTAVDDGALPDLIKLTGLRQLELAMCGISDFGLPQLLNLAHLENLGLADNPLTDASIPILQKMTSLTFLDVADTAISPEGIAELAARLPQCDVWPS